MQHVLRYLPFRRILRPEGQRLKDHSMQNAPKKARFKVVSGGCLDVLAAIDTALRLLI